MKRVSRRHSKKSNTLPLEVFLPLALVLGFLAELFSVLIPFLLLVAAVAIVGGIAFGVYSISDKHAKAQNAALDIVNTPESLPVPLSIASSLDFSNKEEERINLLFRDYLGFFNDRQAAQAHCNYIKNRISALHTLKRHSEAEALEEKLSSAQEQLSSFSSNAAVAFSSRANDDFYRIEEIKRVYTPFVGQIHNVQIPLISEFFRSSFIKILPAGDESALIFLPCYVLIYSGPDQKLKLQQYNTRLSISHTFFTQMLGSDERPSPTDEIEHIGYLHEKKDGSRDMRYSYENNPSYYFVYRGTVMFKCGAMSFEQNFGNKSSAEEFESAFKKYKELIKEKYKSTIDAIIRNPEKAIAITDNQKPVNT